MEKKHYKEYYILINTMNFDIRLTKTKLKASEIAGIHRHSIPDDNPHYLAKQWIIAKRKEE